MAVRLSDATEGFAVSVIFSDPFLSSFTAALESFSVTVPVLPALTVKEAEPRVVVTFFLPFLTTSSA